MKPIKITAITDNRPGHQKQTEAVIQALSEYTPVNIQYRRVDCDLKSDLRNWWDALMAIMGGFEKGGEGADIVIGTGSHTHATVIKMGRLQGSKKIICMSPPIGLGFFFDLCFIPEHDRISPGKNFFLTVGPPNLSKNTGRHENDKGLILIGGVDPKSHHWHSSKILAAIEHIIARTPSVRWTVSTSPRTPEEMEHALMADFQHNNVEIVPFDRTFPGWIEEQYATSKFVWVTADSMSMIYEAISAGCNVGLIPVEWKKRFHNKFAGSEQHLIDQGYVIPYRNWLNEERFPGQNSEINEARRCAEEILRRWWPERLP